MSTTKLNNGQLPTTLSSKTIDNTNDISTTTTKLKISGGTNGQVLSTDGSGNLSWASGVAAPMPDGDYGDIVVSNSGGTWTIDTGVVDSNKLASNSVTTEKITDSNVTLGKIQGISANTVLGRGSTSGAPQTLLVTNGLRVDGTNLELAANDSANWRQQAYLTGSTTISGFNSTVCSVTIGAGTWLILGNGTGIANNLGFVINGRITAGGSTIAEASQSVNATGTVNCWVAGNVSFAAIHTATGSTTVNLQFSRGNTAPLNNNYNVTDGNLAGTGSSGTDRGTVLTAVRLI